MSREAMQMALEALEKVTKHFTRTPSTLMDSEARGEAHNAITALRQALETEQESVRLQCTTCGTVYADGLPPQVAQPEQEPVAWMYVNYDGECEQIEYGEPMDDPSVTPLYTAPPKKEWVGLTLDEVNECLGKGMWIAIDVARFMAIKLREKNT